MTSASGAFWATLQGCFLSGSLVGMGGCCVSAVTRCYLMSLPVVLVAIP